MLGTEDCRVMGTIAPRKRALQPEEEFRKGNKKQRLDRGQSKQHDRNDSSYNQNGYPDSRPRASQSEVQGLLYTTSKPIRKEDLPRLPPIIAKYQEPVFTHPSLGSMEMAQGIMKSYDRLEFLGDAYIEIIASRLLWSLCTVLSAARMSQVRESLVKNETLSEYAVAYGMDKKLRIDDKARPQDKRGQLKLNGDVFEAYVAAVVLSDPVKGMETAEDWLTKLWEPRMKDVEHAIPDEKSKGELQKKLGGKGVKLDYIEERDRIMHKGKGLEMYFIGVYLTGWGYENQYLGSGEGVSKKAAGFAAAKQALENSALMGEIEAERLEIRSKPEYQNGSKDERPKKDG